MYNIQLDLRVEIFMEGDVYVALSPELNVSSYGQSVEDARHSLIEAVEAFIGECAEMGTLDDVLEESGFTKYKHVWHSRQAVKEEYLAVAV